MPGFDGTGPLGQGPMTGGARGFCAMPYRGYRPYTYAMRTPCYLPPRISPFYGPVFGVGRGGLPWGGGRGRCFGGGRGFRRWW